jgi:ribosomal protein L3 glutamine methyltransferase
MKLRELIQTQSQLLKQAQISYGHGTTNAYDEAVWLVLWCLSKPLDSLDESFEEVLDTAEIMKVEQLIQKRIATRLPAAYLTQEAWLQGIPFYIDSRSIVPRSLIAELIVDPDGFGQLDAWLHETTHQVLDLCTGNGSLAVLAALAFPDVTVTAADISMQALEVAQINIQKHQLQNRIQWVHSNLFNQLEGCFDLILCNPPYVNSSSMQILPAEYLHEPALALAGGVDGMTLIRPLLQQAPHFMTDKAVLVLEIGHEREHFERAFPNLAAVWLETSAGEDQVLLLTREALSLTLT